jgi:hypothetical protein
VNIFFREERLPIAEGWKRSAILIDNDNLGALTDKITAATNWAPDGDCPTITFVASANVSDTVTI